MKLTYVVAEPINPNNETGAAAHIRENIKNLKELGYEVNFCNSANHEKNISTDHLKPGLSKKIYHSLAPDYVKKLTGNYKAKRQHSFLLGKHLKELRECDIIYERDAFHHFDILKYQKKMKKPWIIECNSFFWGEMTADFHKPVFREAYKKKHLKKWEMADHLITVSSWFKERMINDGIQPDKISVIHNGVDLSAHENINSAATSKLKTSLGLKDKMVIGFLGSILPWHRLDIFLKALKYLKMNYPVKGLVIGGGIWKKYQDQANQMGLADDVVFTGPVKPERVPEMVAVMDICTVPGSTDYNCPVKIFDYGAARKPVLAANFQGVKELLSNNETGLLFEKGNAEDYLFKLKVLIGSEVLQKKLGGSLFKKVKENHTWRHVAVNTDRVIKRVAGSGELKFRSNKEI